MTAAHRKHAPRTREEFLTAVSELAAQGHSDTTIAHATGLSRESVVLMLGECISANEKTRGAAEAPAGHVRLEGIEESNDDQDTRPPRRV